MTDIGLDPRYAERIEKTDGCWLWRGAVNQGYGRLRPTEGSGAAHRAVYESLVGLIPPGLELDHLCRNTRCVNPAHLEPVTHRENVLRGVGFPAVEARRTHCPAGHEYSGGNLRFYRGERRCRACNRADRSARTARARAARLEGAAK